MNNKNSAETLVPLVIDLAASGEHYIPVLKPEQTAMLKSGLVTLKPGEEVGEHTTDSREEVIVFLEGSGEVETDRNGRKAVKAGQAAYNPPETRHNVINTGESDLRYIYIVTKR